LDILPLEAKLAEILLAVVDGADELDVVINILALKNNELAVPGE